jgi:transposase
MQVSASITDDPDKLKTIISEQQKEINLLRAQLQLLRHQRFGATSEKISPDQLPLFSTDPEDYKNALEKESIDIEVRSHKRKPKRRLGFADNLPVERVELDLPEEEKTCSCCNTPLTKIGEESTKQVEYVPASVKVKDYIRFKYACKHCEGTVKRAALPPQLIPKSFATASLIAYLIVSKYVDHLPLYRIEKQFERLGIYLPRSTMCDWLMAVAVKLFPLIEAMQKIILNGPRIWTDDTIIPLQNDDPLRKTVKQARLWVYIGGPLKDPPLVVYDYTRTRSQQGPHAFLEGYEGFLQADAYSGYQGLYESGNIIEVACMAHCRRKFYEAAIATQGNSRAHYALMQIRKIYQVEWACKDMQDAQRKAYRMEYAKPILDNFKVWAENQVDAVLPKSPLGKALFYMLNHWSALNRYLDEGFLKPDNNKAEQHIRPIALGRKNYLFVGSDRGGNAAATYYSLVETCKNYNINPLVYFMDVLTRLPDCKTEEDVQQLIPSNWLKNSLGR